MSNNSKFRMMTVGAIVLAFLVGMLGVHATDSIAQTNSIKSQEEDVELPDTEPSANPSTRNSMSTETETKTCIARPKQALRCFPTEAEALRVTSGGRFNLTSGQTLRASRLPYPYNAVLYQFRNYRGAKVIFAYFRCGTGTNIPSFFNNRTSSLRLGYCGKVTL
jgi:hypothetical protein